MKWIIGILLVLLIVTNGCGIHKFTDTGKVTPIQNASVDGCFIEQYPDYATSKYILPYKVGMSFTVSQGNCGVYSTHRPQCTAQNKSGVTISCGDRRYAYDFALPIGEKILAVRSGIVVDAVEKFSNTNNNSDETNFISIEHDDGTVAVYLHLSPNGVLVETGDTVIQGEEIGIAGSSGYTGPFPHLHFDVLAPPFDTCSSASEIYSGCKSVPITFKNAKPQNVPLIERSTYEALTY